MTLCLPLRPALSALLLIISLPGSAAPADAPARPITYLHANLIDTAAGVVRPDVAITTQGTQVTVVSSATEARAEDAEIVDLTGRYVLPGLVNTHVHLATAADPAAARAYLRRELFSGVTTVRDMAGDVRLLAELKREAQLDEFPSPDIFYAALFAGPEFFSDPRTHDAARGATPGELPWMRAISAQTDLRQAVAEAKGTGATALKLYADLSANLVYAITLEAHRQGLLVWAHTAVFPAMPADVVAAGVDVVSHACLLGYQVSAPAVLAYHGKQRVNAQRALHSPNEIDPVLDAMRRQGTILDATVLVYEAADAPSCTARISEQLARRAYRAGVQISAGTDDDADWKDPDSALDRELSLLVNKIGLSTADALRAATVIGARAAGQQSAIGLVEAGKLANFVVLSANPLQQIDNVRRVEMVIKHGNRYLRRDYHPISVAPENDLR